jgi:hypothetical protein
MRKILFIAIWALVIPVKALTALLGFLVTPITYRYRDTDFKDVPRALRPWTNPEDWKGGWLDYPGSLPTWWQVSEGSGFKAFYKYHAIRNPANGLRNFSAFSLDVVKEKVCYTTPRYFKDYEPQDIKAAGLKSARYWAWQGWKAGFQYVRVWNDTRYTVIKLGWRVQPSDAEDGPWFAKDAGFAGKVLLYRKY